MGRVIFQWPSRPEVDELSLFSGTPSSPCSLRISHCTHSFYGSRTWYPSIAEHCLLTLLSPILCRHQMDTIHIRRRSEILPFHKHKFVSFQIKARHIVYRHDSRRGQPFPLHRWSVGWNYATSKPGTELRVDDILCLPWDGGRHTIWVDANGEIQWLECLYRLMFCEVWTDWLWVPSLQ